MKNLLLLGYFLIAQFTLAQEIVPQLDHTSIKIGEPIKYKAKINYEIGDNVIFPSFSDSLSHHISILEQKLDTVKINGELSIEQNLELTGYEPGKFKIPSFIIKKNDQKLKTKEIEIEIQDIAVDTTKNTIFPIKPLMEEQYSVKDYWNKYWLYGIIALALFIIGVILIILYIRSKSNLSKESYKTPYEEAKASLKSLDAKNYIKRDEQKEYYSQLSFILRRYLGRIYNFSALEILSDDLVNYVAKKSDILSDDKEKFKQFLFDADLVKFAKQRYDHKTNESYREWVEEFIDRLKPLDIPENEDLVKDKVTGEKYKQFNNN